MHALRKYLDIYKIKISDSVTLFAYILYKQCESYFSKLIIRLYLFIRVILLYGKCTHDYVRMYHKGMFIYMPDWY